MSNIEDLNFLKKQLVPTRWSETYMDLVIDEYKKFLSLRAINSNLSPSNDIDIIWHTHILNTKSYREYCNLKFKKVIDHDPSCSFDQKARSIRLQNTINEYAKVYGNPNKRVWENPMTHLPSKNVNKKIIWYENVALYERYKQNKPVLKIIFTLSNSPTNYNGSIIMYLSNDDITLNELSAIIDKKTNFTQNNTIMKVSVRWITTDPKLSQRFKHTKTFATGSRHITDIESNDMLISHYYKNKIELIAIYAPENEGC